MTNMNMETTPRNWCEDASRHNYVELMSEHFRSAGSMATLHPVQAASLVEMGRVGGLFGPQSMGSGSHLTSILSVMVSGSQRPLMILPANLLAKMQRAIQVWRQDWFVPLNLHVVSFETLGHASHSKDLEDMRPDLVVVPDCYKLKNEDSKATQIVAEYMEQNPSTKFVAFSGTDFDEYLHVIRWCLKDRMPVRAEGESRGSYRLRLLQTSGIVGSISTGEEGNTALFSEMFIEQLRGEAALVDLLVAALLSESKGQSRTFIQQGAVKVDGVKIMDVDQKITPGVYEIKVGKNAWTNVTFERQKCIHARREVGCRCHLCRPASPAKLEGLP